jgi:hypothetical protein
MKQKIHPASSATVGPTKVMSREALDYPVWDRGKLHNDH